MDVDLLDAAVGLSPGHSVSEEGADSDDVASSIPRVHSASTGSKRRRKKKGPKKLKCHPKGSESSGVLCSTLQELTPFLY